MTVCGFRKIELPGAVIFVIRFVILLTALMPMGWIAHSRSILPHTYLSLACGGFSETEGDYHIDERSSDELIVQAERVESGVPERRK